MYLSACYSTVETFIWSNENIFYKTENVFVSFFNNSRTWLTVFVIWKNRCVVLRTLKHRNMFFINYSHVWWRAIFNIHFSNPANFILFLYLDVFLWLNFVWMSICHLFQLLCHIIVIVYATHFRGHSEISALASWYQHWHWKILFSSYIFFKKNKIWPTQLLSSFAPVSLCYNYSFLYDLLFIHPNASISFVENRLFECLVYPSINVSKK